MIPLDAKDRVRIYRRAIRYYERMDALGLCTVLRVLCGLEYPQTGLLEEYFPELWEMRPRVFHSVYWWHPTDDEGLLQRLVALEMAILKCKHKIT